MPSIHFSILKLTIGAPGSGKSTWVREYKKTHPLTYVISTDEILSLFNPSIFTKSASKFAKL